MIRTYLYAAALAALLAGLAWGHHHVFAQGEAAQKARDDTTIAARDADIKTAKDANAAFADTLAKLRESQAACEAGRLVDGALQKAALANRDRTATQLAAAARDARARLDAELAGRCKAWAEQPACGVTP